MRYNNPNGDDVKKFVATGILWALGLVSMMSSVGASTPATLAGLSAAQVLNTSLKAANAQQSATTLSSVKILGSNNSPIFDVRVVATSGPQSGYRFETIQGARDEIIYADGVAYGKFDAALIKVNFGSTDKTLANKWISFTKGNKFYNYLSSGNTLPSVLQGIHPSGILKLTAPTTINGVSVIGVTGKMNVPTVTVSGPTVPVNGIETLFVSTTAPFLPKQMLVEQLQAGVTATTVVSFKNWGRDTPFPAPKNFTPFAQTGLGS